MAIFISTKALAKIPNQFSSTYVPMGRKVLRSSLRTNPFFANLAKQSQGAKELKNGDGGNEVNTLQVVLNVVRNIQTGEQQSLVIDGVFGPVTENALMAAQQALGIAETGILDSGTLVAMDSLLVESGVVYNITNGLVYHKGTDQRYEVSITSINGEIILKNEKLKITPLPDQGKINLQAIEALEEDGVYARDAYELPDITGVFIADDRVENSILSRNGYFVEEGIVPKRPSGLPPDVKPRTIKDGETLISIIHEEYLKNPLTMYKVADDPSSGVLHEFPARSLAIEDKDYRIRFLANLIYYMNQDPGISYAIHRSSIAPVAVDFADEHLDEVNLYDNDTFGLNYKSFVERMNIKDNNYEWNLYPSNYTVPESGESYTFDAPFSLDVGEDLYLPSREFVEALFLHLNFRPKAGEMYEQKMDAEGNAFFDWISQTGFDTFMANVTSNISDAVERAMTIDIYNEAYQFFKNVYGWVIDIFNDFWPRSMGFQASLDAEIAALFGVGVGGSSYVWRKVTEKDEITIQTIMDSEIRATAGVGVGFNIGGTKKGKGANVGSKKASKKGVAPYAGVDIGVGVRMYQEHEFPISRENTALLAMMLPAIRATSNIATGLGKILNYILIINIDPMDYITKQVVEISAEGRGFAQLNLGLNIANASDYGQNEAGSYTVDKKNQDALSVNGIAKLLKKLNFSYGGGAEVSSGYAWETEWKYGNLPDLYKYDGRMASKVTTQIELFWGLSAGLDATSSDFIQRFILGSIGGNLILPTFNFDKGIAIIAGLELKRTAIPENHQFANYDLSIANLNDPNNTISRFMGAKLYSGEFEIPVTPASEIIVNINIDELQQIINGQSGNTEILTVENLITVFDKLTIHKRFSAGLESFASKQNNKVLDRVRIIADKYRNKTYQNGEGNEAINFKEYVKSLQDSAGFEFVSSVEIGAEFLMSSTIHAVKYLLLRLRFMASRQKYEDDNQLNVYLIREKLIYEAYQEALRLATNDFSEADFDFLLNDPTWGIRTILDIGGNGEDELVTYNETLGELFRFLDQGELRGLLQEVKREDLITQNQEKRSELLKLLIDVFKQLVKQSSPTIKFNSLLAISAGLNLKLALGPKVNLAAFFQAGLFDEIMMLEDGRLILEDAITDTPLYDIIQAIAKQFSDDSNIPDFDSDTVRGGIISQTLLHEPI